jgi:hypothetical protein
MRLHEFSKNYAEIIEDEAESRGDSNLIAALSFLQNRSANQHLVPKVRADSLINMVKNTGVNEFNLESLLNAHKTNDSVKSLIKDIKDDENGTKYIYLQSRAEDTNDTDVGDMSAPRAPAEKVVGSMAKSALAKRS